VDASGINLVQGLFNALTALGPVGLLLITVWGKLKDQQREVADAVIAEFAKQTASKTELSDLRRQVEEVQTTQRQMGVIITRVDHVDRRLVETREEIKELGSNLSTQLTGAMEHVRDRIDDLKDMIGKKP
jgi:predicted nuclease with TOPRIM domain